jgi:hypothetical protein
MYTAASLYMYISRPNANACSLANIHKTLPMPHVTAEARRRLFPRVLLPPGLSLLHLELPLRSSLGQILSPKGVFASCPEPLSHYRPKISPSNHPPTNQTTKPATTSIPANFKTAIRSPCLAILVSRPALPRKFVLMLEKTSFVLSSVDWLRALSYMSRVTCFRAEVLALREDRRALFCLEQGD